MNEKWVSREIVRAQKRLALSDWQITWEFSEEVGEGDIDLDHWTEKRAHVRLEAGMDKDQTRLVIYHELLHLIVAPIWRGVGDWADHLIRGQKAREIFDEQINTRENEVLDFIVCQVLGVKQKGAN